MLIIRLMYDSRSASSLVLSLIEVSFINCCLHDHANLSCLRFRDDILVVRSNVSIA